MAKVYVEVSKETGLPIRIFKCTKKALASDPLYVTQMEKRLAVASIRSQVVERAKRKNLILCEFCGTPLTEETGQMHEVVSRGDGGEISLDNSRFICSECHIGKTGEHGDRQWGGRKDRALHEGKSVVE